MQACRAGCLACAKCAYVSVSSKKRTCLWYSACDTSRLVGGAGWATFETHFVRELDSRELARTSVRQWRLRRMLLGAAVVPRERGPRIWVINTSVDECRNSRNGKDLFEEKLPALFRSGFLRAASPAGANFLYHPACLVDAFFRLRGQPRALRVVESAVMREVEVAARAAVKRTPVIVNSLRCYTRSPRGREDMPFGFPTLWFGHQFLRFCAEAFPTLDSELSLYLPYCPATPWVVPPGLSPNFDRPVKVLFQGGVATGVANGGRPSFCAEAFPALDSELSLYLPYCPATPWVVPPGPSPNFDRPVKALFQGGVATGVANGGRLREIGALMRTPNARLVAIDNQTRRGQYNTSFRADDERLKPMREATYTLCPPGDTPESQRIYQAISQGSIPLLDWKFQRPPLVNWSALSAPIRILGGRLALLGAEEERAAQWEVWRERMTITCEASNPRFREYVEKGLRRIADASRRRVSVKVY